MVREERRVGTGGNYDDGSYGNDEDKDDDDGNDDGDDDALPEDGERLNPPGDEVPAEVLGVASACSSES